MNRKAFIHPKLLQYPKTLTSFSQPPRETKVTTHQNSPPPPPKLNACQNQPSFLQTIRGADHAHKPRRFQFSVGARCGPFIDSRQSHTNKSRNENIGNPIAADSFQAPLLPKLMFVNKILFVTSSASLFGRLTNTNVWGLLNTKKETVGNERRFFVLEF